MNPHHQIKLLPYSQPMFTEEETASESEYASDNDESQSLISPKKGLSNKFSSSAVTLDCSDLSTKVLGDNTENQQFFTEAEENTVSESEKDKTRKRQMPNNEESRSSPKNRCSNGVSSNAATSDCSSRNSKVLEVNFPTNEQKANSDTESDLRSINGDNIPSVTCIGCIFEKELDKRNYYFGNLLIGELQFLPPCMRSEAYVTILKYIDSLKQKHRRKSE